MGFEDFTGVPLIINVRPENLHFDMGKTTGRFYFYHTFAVFSLPQPTANIGERYLEGHQDKQY